MVEFTVSSDWTGRRLDQVLAAQAPDVSRSRAAQLIKDGAVTVDGATVKPSTPVRAGQRVVAHLAPRPTLDASPQELPLTVVFEDEHLLVIDKAAGMVVHPAAGHYDGTLVNALLHHRPALADLAGHERPGIVHRLDKGTSGLLVVAKTGLALSALQRQFATRTVTKLYLAIVVGRPPTREGRIDRAIGRHVRERQKISSVTAKGHPATTLWRLEKSGGGVSALTCTLLTGRTHQIRVHCAESGWPLVGDATYGGVRALARVTDPTLRAACRALDRVALHAERLAFAHPVSGGRLEFRAPVPLELKTILDLLESLDD